MPERVRVPKPLLERLPVPETTPERVNESAASKVLTDKVLAPRPTVPDRVEVSVPPAMVSTLLEAVRALLLASADLHSAELLLREALATQTKLLGTDHIDTAKTKSNLGVVLIKLRRWDEAEGLLRESLDTRRRHAPGKNLTLGRGLLDLASLMRRMKRFSDAQELYEEAVPVYREVVGTGHLQYGIVLNGLALLLFDQDKAQESVPLFRKSVQLKAQLERLAAIGLALNSGIAEEQLTTFDNRETLESRENWPRLQ